MQIVLATANPDKAREIQAILADVDLVARPTDVPDVDETEDTLVGNARLKAVALMKATGMPAIADDTGLEVDALNGAPGVYSARYAGENVTYEDNVNKLVREMEGESERSARFRTVALLAFPDGSEIVAEGVVEGTISTVPTQGQGFGYDPVFVPNEGDGRSFAQMSIIEKNAISHRGRAFRQLKALLGN